LPETELELGLLELSLEGLEHLGGGADVRAVTTANWPARAPLRSASPACVAAMRKALFLIT
jgi:hypothetical protein